MVRNSVLRTFLAGPLAALLAAVALVAGACGGGSQDASGDGGGDGEAEPTYGGELVYGMEAANTDGWCLPEAQLAISGIQVARAIYDTLTVPNADGEYVPFLAESVEPNEDFTRWTITLRDGVTFHDGTALDATVVKNNLDAYRGAYPGRSPLLFLFVFANIAAVDVVDDLTLTVTTATPWPALPAYLYLSGRVGIMAQAQLDDPATCDRNLIGTGPFVFDEWEVADFLSATRNEDYWQVDASGNQLPYLDRVEFRTFTDATARSNALLSGELNGLHTNTAGEIATLAGDAEAGTVALAQSPARAEVTYLLFNAAKAPFDNRLAREAVALAVDREQMRETVYQGVMDLASGPFAPGVAGYLEDAGLPDHDPDRAEELVAQYEQETGEPLAFTMTIVNFPDAQLVAQFVQEQLAEVGIEMSIVVVEQAAEISTALGDEWQALNWRNHPGDDPDTQYVWWYGGAPTNFNKFDDPEINRLLDEGRVATDPAERRATYEELNRYFAEQLYNVWTVWTNWTVATAPEVRGIQGPELPDGSPPAEGFVDGHPVSGVWIAQ